jgi:hypothetical protein
MSIEIETSEYARMDPGGLRHIKRLKSGRQAIIHNDEKFMGKDDEHMYIEIDGLKIVDVIDNETVSVTSTNKFERKLTLVRDEINCSDLYFLPYPGISDLISKIVYREDK